jgi:hypothetical protein
VICLKPAVSAHVADLKNQEQVAEDCALLNF